jgi:deazaflavin-dependent oxidoreductase (nitroreductase family)
MSLITPRVKDVLFRMGTAVHTDLYRWTGGRLGGRAGRMPMLLLTTTGRKSGRARTTPLGYLPDGDRMVLVASYGGDDRHPQWYRNLQANPEATVQVGAQARRVRAATATAEEKAELWPRVVALYPGYGAYQRKTTRDIPLVILTPA